MTAFDEILAYSSKEKFNDFRQSLVAHKRGTLSSGAFSSSMAIQYSRDLAQESLINDDVESKTPQKIFLRSGKTLQPGLIFDENGTDRAIANISSGGKLKLLDEFGEYLKFSTQEDRDIWLQTDRTIKRRCLSRTAEELNKKTDINYRTHGDRLHYFTVGLVEVKVGGDKLKYPLFLFSCNEVNKNTLEVDVESSGFLNFWLDRNYLENSLVKAIGSYEVNMNESFASLLNTTTSKINNLQLGTFDEIHVDPKYSAVTIVTGFEAEYIDPFWEKLK